MLCTNTWKRRVIYLAICVIAGAGVFQRAWADDPTPTPVPTATPDYSTDIHINEFLPDPVGADATDEFVELYNASIDPVDLSGWVLFSSKSDGTSIKSFIISADVSVAAKDYVVFYSSETGSMLANTGDRVVSLIDPLQVTHEAAAYSGSHTGKSYNRMDNGMFIESAIITPGAANQFDPTPTPSPTLTPTPDPTPVPVYSDAIRINEFIPNPAGDDTKLEFIELYNTSEDAVDIAGWKLDDIADGGSSVFTIPQGVALSAHGYVVFYSDQTKIALNNDSDHVRLLRPDGVVQDDAEYASSKEGYSYNHIDGSDFQQSSHTTPGEENIIELPSPTPTPTPKATSTPKITQTSTPIDYQFSTKIVINEIYPNPSDSSILNEFIELKNNDNRSISLAGWTVDDIDGGSKPYHFKDTDYIKQNQLFIIDKKTSNIALNNDHDRARLIDPDGKIMALVSYEKTFAGQSYNRTLDGLYVWSDGVTPGKENMISVQEKPSQTVAAKKPAAKNRSARVAGVSRIASSATPISPSYLPWPSTVERDVHESIAGTAAIPSLQNAKQRLFVIFGAMCAGMQLASGISRKEKIWFGRT